MNKYTFSTFNAESDKMRKALAETSCGEFRLIDIRDEREGIFAGLSNKKMFGPAYYWYLTCVGECTPDNSVEADKILTYGKAA